MSRIVGILGRQFGFAVAVDSPSIAATDNGDGTATVTISGSTAGSTNTVFTQTVGVGTWVSVGSRTGDGSVTFPISNGRYYIYVKSTAGSSSEVSNVVLLAVYDSADSFLDESPAHIVAVLLADLGYGADPEVGGDWPIYDGLEPDTPDNCITIFDTPGELQGTVQIDGEIQERFGLQIRIRCSSQTVGWTKANALAVVCDQVVSQNTVIIGSNQYLVTTITRRGGILNLGRERPQTGGQGVTSKRSVYTFNAVVSVHKTN